MTKEMIHRPLPVKARLHLAHEDNAKLRARIAALEAQQEPDARPAEQAVTEAMVERAFRDGVRYGTICEVTDIDEAWRTSAVRAALKEASNEQS